MRALFLRIFHGPYRFWRENKLKPGECSMCDVGKAEPGFTECPACMLDVPLV